MAVTIYTGTMGSGKTYEAVKMVIIPQLAAGRSIIANIDGLNPHLVREYCADKYKKDLSEIGQLRVVTRDKVAEPDFFPAWSGSGTTYEVGPYVQPGDLVIVDEASRFYGTDSKISARTHSFFREHRHLTDPKGVASDVVLLTQHASDLNRKISNVVDFSWRCKKLKAIGLHSGYVVALWDGKIRGEPFKTERRLYDKKIFPLYRSYAGGSGTEKDTDNRTNILKSWRFWTALIGLPLFFIFLLAFARKHFFEIGGNEATVKHQSETSINQQSTGNFSNAQQTTKAANATAAQNSWQILGTFEAGIVRVVVERNGNATRMVPLDGCETYFGFVTKCKNSDGTTSLPWSPATTDSSGSGKL
jgi:zona occludens toxin